MPTFFPQKKTSSPTCILQLACPFPSFPQLSFLPSHLPCTVLQQLHLSATHAPRTSPDVTYPAQVSPVHGSTPAHFICPLVSSSHMGISLGWPRPVYCQAIPTCVASFEPNSHGTQATSPASRQAYRTLHSCVELSKDNTM